MSALATLGQTIPSLRRYACSLLRNAADADELVQDCLVRALDKPVTVRAEGQLRPGLFAIMRNLHINRRRRTKLSEATSWKAREPVPARLEIARLLAAQGEYAAPRNGLGVGLVASEPMETLHGLASEIRSDLAARIQPPSDRHPPWQRSRRRSAE